MIRVVEFKVKPSLTGTSGRHPFPFDNLRMNCHVCSCRLAFMCKLRIAGVIPARLSSTRLPRKGLRELAGRPVVGWVWGAVGGRGVIYPVVVATDSDEVADVCRERGVPVAMTSPNCASGSDRVREVARQV